MYPDGTPKVQGKATIEFLKVEHEFDYLPTAKYTESAV